MLRFGSLLLLFLFSAGAYAQKTAVDTSYVGADTLHYRKVYYFGGTGISVPMGRTKEALGTRLFTGSMGLDISLKNPKYFVIPTLFTMAFSYDQLENHPDYNSMLENARGSIYALSLAGGTRRQFQRLNTYVYAGPAFCLDVEPRAEIQPNNVVRMRNQYSLSPALKLGAGADYRFPGFFLGFELGYFHHTRKIQSNPVNVLTLMVGLKSDITSFSGKVVKVINTVSSTVNGH